MPPLKFDPEATIEEIAGARRPNAPGDSHPDPAPEINLSRSQHARVQHLARGHRFYVPTHLLRIEP